MQEWAGDPAAAGRRMTAAQSLARSEEVIRGIVAAHDGPASLVADIACEIGAEIVEGIIRPGQDLNTVDLSRRYDTSRTPVREALMLIEKAGLVDIEPRRRPRAHVPSIEEVREIYRVRTVLFELMAMELAARATKADIAILAEVLERMRAAVTAGDARRYMWLSVEFHDKETLLCGNATAKRIHDSLLLRTLAMRRLSLARSDRLRQSLDDHFYLVRAYESHDAILAGAILRSNHGKALAAIEAHYRKHGTLVECTKD